MTKLDSQHQLEDNIIIELQRRVALSRFTIYMLILLPIYNIFIELIDTQLILSNLPTTFITSTELVFFAGILYAMIHQMKLPLALFGFNLNNAKKNIYESLVWSLIFCFILLLFKWFLINYVSSFAGLSLFYHNVKFSNAIWILSAFIYVFFVVAQVFIMQGALQSSLIELISLPYATVFSVIIPTIIFVSLHIDLNIIYAIAVLPPGLFWAILYNRQRSLLGVTLSHMIIGIWAFWFLGVHQIFEISSQALIT